MQATWTDWVIFAGIVLGAMLFDRLVFGRPQHSLSFREAVTRSGFWLTIGLLFCGFTWFRFGTDYALTYLLAYVVEESLSVDNLFVFLVIFRYYGLTQESRQQRVLFWGVFGAIVMRGVFIGLGTAWIQRFHWLIYVFGGFLVFTGVKLLFRKDESFIPEENLALRLASRFLRTTSEFEGDKFFIFRDGRRYATSLFLVLIVIEFTDLLFAVDSVPAVLAISDEVFLVYTSNILAVLGLRALYFAIAHMMDRFTYLGLGLALVLILIGAKMLLSEVLLVPPVLSLLAVVSVLTFSIGMSLYKSSKSDAPSS